MLLKAFRNFIYIVKKLFNSKSILSISSKTQLKYLPLEYFPTLFINLSAYLLVHYFNLNFSCSLQEIKFLSLPLKSFKIFCILPHFRILQTTSQQHLLHFILFIPCFNPSLCYLNLLTMVKKKKSHFGCPFQSSNSEAHLIYFC